LGEFIFSLLTSLPGHSFCDGWSAAKLHKVMTAKLGVFSQSVSPDWEKENSLGDLCASNERSEWAVNIYLNIMYSLKEVSVGEQFNV
jgi:hypothetical protein